MRIPDATVRAVSGLTSRWARTVSGPTVFSAAGVWPLLAFLATAAQGTLRRDLLDAVGLPSGEPAAAARQLMAAMNELRGVDTALGLWTHRDLPLRAEWVAGLAAGTHGVLTGDLRADRAALDAWAAERTDGLIRRMPAALTDDTELVLAGALALRTRWLRPFHEHPLMPETGPWRGRELLGLYRRSTLLDRVGVADTPEGTVTELKVLGDQGTDVHLLLGEERMAPAQVLCAGLDVLAGGHQVLPGTRLPYGSPGPGLEVVREHSATPDPPTLDVTTVAYDLTAEHDLLAAHRVFGLTAALHDPGAGQFPGISAHSPGIGAARQSAVAAFGALGFRAAVVTAITAVATGVPLLRHPTTEVRATFDRPFGFLALHRTSRLVLAAGWVTDPQPFREGYPDIHL
ncbi:serpin family protein [Streptomyces sp. NPDC059785]|uniref:serpin family protein n=1 Tax=Streptomyces sp. NPDC059785 TaxID=3346945 RepID=UPI0036612F80